MTRLELKLANSNSGSCRTTGVHRHNTHGHLRRLRPGDAHSRNYVSDSVSLFRWTASTSQHPLSRIVDRLPVASCHCFSSQPIGLRSTSLHRLPHPSTSVGPERSDTAHIPAPSLRSRHWRSRQSSLATSVGKDRLQGRRADAGWWCFAVPATVHVHRRHSFSTQTPVLSHRQSVRSCCQTFYCRSPRLSCRWCSYMERFTVGRYLLTAAVHI